MFCILFEIIQPTTVEFTLTINSSEGHTNSVIRKTNIIKGRQSRAGGGQNVPKGFVWFGLRTEWPVGRALSGAARRGHAQARSQPGAPSVSPCSEPASVLLERQPQPIRPSVGSWRLSRSSRGRAEQ